MEKKLPLPATVTEPAVGRGQILVLAHESCQEFYHSFSLKGEQIRLCPIPPDMAVVEQANLDLIIIDCGFSAKNSIQLASRVKKVRPDLPVFFLTEDPSEGVALGAYKAGIRLFFRRPFNVLEFKSVLEKFLNTKRTSREKRNPFACTEDPFAPDKLQPATSDKPVNLLRVIQYIEDNLSERLTLDMLATEANMSKYHFCRYFYRFTGMSPMRFVAYMRIERAKAYLRRGDQTVSIVADMIGFNDLGTFIRQFKNFTGLTPSAYQDQTR